MAPDTATPELSPRLLQRISAELPAGDFLYYDPLYDQIREARRVEPNLPQGVWKRPLKTANWGLVERLCVDGLETRTKDLNIAVWLTEAWIYQYGIPGLERGVRLVHGLCEEFWEDLHPMLDPEEPERRYAPLFWMDDKLPHAVSQVSISRPAGEDSRPFSWADRTAALVLDRRAEKDPAAAKAAAAGGARPTAAVEASIALTPPRFYVELTAQLTSAGVAVAELDRLLETRCHGADAPTLSGLSRLLHAMRQWSQRVAEEKGVGTAPPEEEALVSELEPLQAGAPEVPLVSEAPTISRERRVIESREEAYRLLAEAADFLGRAEPHSPTPYLVKRAVAWGQKPLTELLEEFARDGNNVEALYGLLGIGKQR